MPSVSCTVAATGHTSSQGALSQWTQSIGWNTTSGFSAAAPSACGSVFQYRPMRLQCISRLILTWSVPTLGMLFSAWQATMHAEQPMQAFMSIAMPQACGLLKTVGASGCVGGYFTSGGAYICSE